MNKKNLHRYCKSNNIYMYIIYTKDLNNSCFSSSTNNLYIYMSILKILLSELVFSSIDILIKIYIFLKDVLFFCDLTID